MNTQMLKTASFGSLLTLILGNPATAYNVENFLASSPKIPSKEELMKIDGVGEANALKVLACCELSTRYIVGTEAKSVTSPEDVIPRLAFLKFEEQEHFVVITLDSSNHVIGVHDVTKGLVNQTQVAPREVFRHAVMDNAVSVMVAHNHPSGNTEPSQEDRNLTRTLCAAGKIMQVPVIDHIVIGRCGFTSICRENPELFESALA